MYYMTEQNERRARRHAFVLAILLHLALAAGLYLSMDTRPDTQNLEKSALVKPKVNQPGPKAKNTAFP